MSVHDQISELKRRMRPLANGVLLIALAGTFCNAQPAPRGMVWIPGGEFMMGSGSGDKLARRVEQPAHEVRVSGFWMDTTEVTNAQFSEFVKATGYITMAEKDIDWNELKKQVPPGTPKTPDAQLKAGSMVFTPRVVVLGDRRQLATSRGSEKQH